MSESINPLKPGKTYKMNPDGTFTEAVADPAQSLSPVPDEDLPPDMRANSKKAEDMSEALKKIEEGLKTAVESPKLPPVAVSDKERQNFLRAVISGDPYTKEFQIFGGKMRVVFKTLSTSELDAISEAIVIQSSRVPYASMLAMAGAHMRFAMACSMIRMESHGDDGIKIKDLGWSNVLTMYPDAPRKDSFYVKQSDGSMVRREADLIAVPGQKVMWAAADKFSDIPAPLYNILFELYQKFDAEVNQMTREAADPAFFTNGAVGL